MSERTAVVPVKLANGDIVRIEVTQLGGEQDVAGRGMPSFDNVTSTIRGVAQELLEVMKEVKPKKAAVEFGVEIAVQSGQLTSYLVKGSGTANMKITLEWESETSA